MTEYKRIAIDTSKAVFTLHGIDQRDRVILQRNLRRAQFLPFFEKLPPTEIVLEACGGAHHWARELTALGHSVRLLPPQYVKPFVKRGKNDRNDAGAICETGARPGIHPVPIKTVEQQAQGMMLKVRETLIGQRTALSNTLRGLAAEFGITTAKGLGRLAELLATIAADPALPVEAKDSFIILGEQLGRLDEQIKMLEKKVAAAHKANPLSTRLATIPGLAAIGSLTVATRVNADDFASGRHFSAWMGIVPKEHSTGGKQRMGGISRAGDERLRQLFILGATSVIRAVTRPGGSKLASPWLLALLARKPRKLAAVALANKMARIAWAMMKSGEVYRRQVAA
jgi:transposase